MTVSTTVQPRKYLSIDALIQGLRERFEAIPDARPPAGRRYALRGADRRLVHERGLVLPARRRRDLAAPTNGPRLRSRQARPARP